MTQTLLLNFLCMLGGGYGDRLFTPTISQLHRHQTQHLLPQLVVVQRSLSGSSKSSAI